jgi:predicted SAM-dependent methyltransferase
MFVKILSYISKRKLSTPLKRDGLKVHIGCGPIDMPGWINIDARPFNHVHLVTDKIKLDTFSDQSIGEIYLCHVLEHFDFVEAEELLALFYKKLAPGGILRISVPDFKLIIDGYFSTNEDLFAFRKALFGGQEYSYNYHKSVYDQKLLTKLFLKTGFNEIRDWQPSSFFENKNEDWSSGKIRVGFKFYPVSLNLCAIKI